MTRRVLLGLTFTLAFVVLQASALGQAAAESVLLNSGSAAAATKAGSALGSALNHGSKQLAGRVPQQVAQPAPRKTSPGTARPASTSPLQSTAVSEGTTPAQGPVISSIQGAVSSRAPANQRASTPGNKTAAGSPQTKPSAQDSVSKPAPRKYKSEITLSFPK
jgi:hypothetical protein